VNAVAAVVVPVFGTVALGFAMARVGIFSRETGAGLTRFMFYIAIPAMLFRGLASAELPQEVPWAYLAAFYLPSFAVFYVAVRLSQSLLGWTRREAGMAGMSACYANIVLLGFPLMHAAFGERGHMPLFILMATQSTLMFPLATYALEIYGQARAGQPLYYLKAAAQLAVNPVIVALALGFAVNLARVDIPVIARGMLELLAAAGPGCALVALGISLAQYRLGGGWRDVLLLVVCKNLLCPLAVWGLGSALGVEQLWLATAVLMAAMPAGLNAFIFASQYDVRQDTVAKTIVVSTLSSTLVASVLLAWFMA
jgi:predicted permease